MNIVFEVEYKYENGYILGRLLNSAEQLDLNSYITITAADIRNIAPSKSLNKGNVPREDLFVFYLENRSLRMQFNRGTKVRII